MRKYRNWILSLGIVAAPTLAVAESSPFETQPTSAQAPASGQHNNQEVAENIAKALRSAKLPGSNIDITVAGGVARLTGQIADPRSKAMATQLVSGIPGVNRVDNQLEVPGGEAPESGVQQAAFTSPFGQELNQIQQVSNSSPSAPVPVPLPESHSTNNQEVAEQIGEALSRAQLSGYQIKIHFANGTATLAGNVISPEQRATADYVVRSIPGVNDVNNQLKVQSPANPRQPVQQVNYQENGAGQPPMMPPMGPGGPMGPMGPGGAQGLGGPPGLPPGYPAGPYPGAPAGMVPPGPAGVYGNQVPGSNPTIYNQPYMPQYAWPAQAQYPNSAAIQYPKQYAASAWPYIGPFYPYPQVPLGWRKASLEWDDGHWMLDFDSKTDRWFWFMNPRNW